MINKKTNELIEEAICNMDISELDDLKARVEKEIRLSLTAIKEGFE